VLHLLSPTTLLIITSASVHLEAVIHLFFDNTATNPSITSTLHFDASTKSRTDFLSSALSALGPRLRHSATRAGTRYSLFGLNTDDIIPPFTLQWTELGNVQPCIQSVVTERQWDLVIGKIAKAVDVVDIVASFDYSDLERYQLNFGTLSVSPQAQAALQ
jgi:hypothetical protein